jgi:uncharacterized protein (TIGR02444 family)
MTAVEIGEPSDGDALWRFSIAFYGRPGVSEALVTLQDRAGRDVNLMLFALWLGVCGRRRLTSEELAIADHIAGPLRADVVAPLRALRRRLRSDPDADVQRLREGVKELELAAERIVLTRLSRIAGPHDGGTQRADRAAVAYSNMALYLGPEIARGEEAATIREAVEAFVRN